MSDYLEGYDHGYEDATGYLVNYYRDRETDWYRRENELLARVSELEQNVESMDWLRATAQRKYEETQEELIKEREK